MKNYKLPTGMADLMPAECKEKRTIEKALVDAFTKSGFLRIETPAIEYYEYFRDGKGAFAEQALFKFADSDGALLALRPDMTMPIARISQTKADKIHHQKYCYVASSYALSAGTGRDREFRQAGVEYVAANDDVTLFQQAEIIALAIDSLLLVGLGDFLIDLSHNELSLAGFDYIGGAEVLSLAKKQVKGKKEQAAVLELSTVYDILSKLGLSEYISFDLTKGGGQDYYTGIKFSGITKYCGSPILGGGLYEIGSVLGFGFALGIKKLTEALRRGGKELAPVTPDVVVGARAGKEIEAMKKAKELRDGGLVVENTFITSETVLKAYAKEKGVKGVEFVK